jgi:hypothetical protein
MAFLQPKDTCFTVSPAVVSEKLRNFIFKKVDPSYEDRGGDCKWNLYCPDEILTRIVDEIENFGEEEDLIALKTEIDQLHEEVTKEGVGYLRFP